MASLPEGGAHGPALRGLQHWLAAVALLLGVTLVVPVLAGLT